jgi:hypothetical protein
MYQWQGITHVICTPIGAHMTYAKMHKVHGIHRQITPNNTVLMSPGPTMFKRMPILSFKQEKLHAEVETVPTPHDQIVNKTNQIAKLIEWHTEYGTPSSMASAPNESTNFMASAVVSMSGSPAIKNGMNAPLEHHGRPQMH